MATMYRGAAPGFGIGARTTQTPADPAAAAGTTPPAGGPRNMVVPAFYRTPFFPYANLNDQLQDALSMPGRGAGQFTNMNTPMLQAILGSRINFGGPGYGGGYPPPGSQQPPGGSYGGGVYPPGAPMQRQMYQWNGVPMQGQPGPTSGPRYYPGGPPSPNPSMSRGGLLGGTPAQPATASARSAPAASPAAGPVNAATTATSDVRALADYFQTLPADQQGNFFNGIAQYGLGKGGTGSGGLGGLLDVELRNRYGADRFKEMVGNWDARQGSRVGREGLPQWLISALGG